MVETLRATGAPPQAPVAAARPRLAARISTQGAAAIRGLVQFWSGTGWRRALIRDTTILSSRLQELPEPAADPGTWEAFWRLHPGAWAGLVARFVALAADDPAAFLAAAEAQAEVSVAGGRVMRQVGRRRMLPSRTPPLATRQLLAGPLPLLPPLQRGKRPLPPCRRRPARTHSNVRSAASTLAR